MKIAIVAVKSKTGEAGGAERFYTGLLQSLRAAGAKTDLILETSDESTFETIEESWLRFYDMDLTSYDGVISTKAPSYLIRHPNHICYLVHTMRVFYDMFETEFPVSTQGLREQRKLVHTLDTAALSYPHTKKVFTIGREVSNRLREWNGLSSEFLHPALLSDSFEKGDYQFVFIPGRLHRWKRLDLIIRAFSFVRAPITLKIAGVGEDEMFFREVAGKDERIEFLGRVSDEQLVKLYANALVVPFVPIHEDYGYVTLEAYKSFKPVITCEDSGEPTYFVKNGVSGFVCKADPQEIAKKIDYLYENKERAKKMGEAGNALIAHIQWAKIAQRLILALQEKDRNKEEKR